MSEPEGNPLVLVLSWEGAKPSAHVGYTEEWFRVGETFQSVFFGVSDFVAGGLVLDRNSRYRLTIEQLPRENVVSEPSYGEYQRFKGLSPAHMGGAEPGGLPPTTPDILGPFYKEGAPEREDLCDEVTLSISGKVTGTDGQPLTATLDFWQANEKGVYDTVGFNFRGKVNVQWTEGGYIYRLNTVVPGCYNISDPGQPDEFRCEHVHVIVTAPGYKKLTTQLYFADSPHDDTDHWFSKDRCIRFGDDPAKGTFDFVLEEE